MEKNNNLSYHDKVQINEIAKLRALQDSLPKFCRTFFRGISNTTAPRTQVAYAFDLGIFFDFIQAKLPDYQNGQIVNYNINILNQISKTDIEDYLEYLNFYTKNGKTYTNDERGKSRKLASLKSFYQYFFVSEMIERNTAALVKLPKIHEKAIIRLDPKEIASLLDCVENGENLTNHERAFHAKTKVRDLALLTLFLGTGIRVSEAVGLDIQDIDLDNCGMKITRKGGYEAIVYFGDEVLDALLPYLEQRSTIIPISGHENALFLSIQSKRMTVRSIEQLVKKYASKITKLKNITPHKLRSTYGTELYKETGDIYLVADVLGHKDVNTTRRHYAAQEDSRRRSAANAVKLRKE